MPAAGERAATEQNVSEEEPYTQPTKLKPLQVSNARFGGDPVSIVSHSRIHSWFISLATFISPAHYSHEIPDSSGVHVHKWATRVTLRRENISRQEQKVNSAHLTNTASHKVFCYD